MYGLLKKDARPQTDRQVESGAKLKLNTMQLETPGGNHCCLMANDVQN